jgi:murein DD-endopeptidase MepM/ murein hydrolase activator NlpD
VHVPFESQLGRWQRSRIRRAAARDTVRRLRGDLPMQSPRLSSRQRGPIFELHDDLLRRMLGHLLLLLLISGLVWAEQRYAISTLTQLEHVGHSRRISTSSAPAAEVAGLMPPAQSAAGGVSAAVMDPVAPQLTAPVEVVDAYRETHVLRADETLGEIAARYGVTLSTLIWSNTLDRGDALMIGQLLRIPRTSGVSHRVTAGDTPAGIARQYGVDETVIRTFGPNRIPDDGSLTVGSDIFVPGGRKELSLQQEQSIAVQRATAAAVVIGDETNVRSGPSTEHPRVMQVQAGWQVELRGRYEDWVQIGHGGTIGWTRTDLLQVSAEQVAVLPEKTDFPPPPPRWVWPARGTVTSGFGPRWGSFHNGLDIANRAWTPIVAASAGRVREAGWCSGYGYCVKIRHPNGIDTVYGHLVDQPPVRAGDNVAAGELIGYMGSTYDRAGGGYSTGVHLHLTLLVNGRAVDPLLYLP